VKSLEEFKTKIQGNKELLKQLFNYKYS